MWKKLGLIIFVSMFVGSGPTYSMTIKAIARLLQTAQIRDLEGEQKKDGFELSEIQLLSKEEGKEDAEAWLLIYKKNLDHRMFRLHTMGYNQEDSVYPALAVEKLERAGK